MQRTALAAAVGVLLGVAVCGAQADLEKNAEQTFATRVEAYVQLHRRVEGPVPPLAASKDMDEVHRLMKAVRLAIVAGREGQGEGYVFTPAVTRLFRTRIGSCLTREDIREIEEDLVDHTPAGMPMPRVNAPLPDDAPFVLVPPQLIRQLPPLPPELRYVILAKALLIWDHHADLVVDMAPKLFDHHTFSTTGQ